MIDLKSRDVQNNRAPVFGRRAVVVSGHDTASRAGIAALRDGGCIADALIAASAALTVVLGHATSIGGDCFLLIHEAESGVTFGLNASGTAPSAATPDRFSKGIESHGPRTPVTPGLISGWDAIYRRFGRLQWRRLFDDAVELAKGHSVSKVLVGQAARYRERLAADPGCSNLYLPGGQPITLGSCLKQPALTETLKVVAANGADGFYTGPIAKTLATFLQERGGLMQTTDLRAYTPLWVDPIWTEYRRHKVGVLPPNSYGLLLLMQLNGLEAIDGSAVNSDPVRRLKAQISAMMAAMNLGAEYVADPKESVGVAERLLGAEITWAMRDAVRGSILGGRIRDQVGTACVLVADSKGNAGCIVQSVFNVFGSGVLDPQTGVLFNNRMRGFDHHPGRPNTIGPGKRPAHTLCPVLVFKGNRPRYVLASPGGVSQTLINAQVLMNLIDGGSDVLSAVEAPRWALNAAGDVIIEPAFPPDVAYDLALAGYNVTRIEDDYFYGSAKGIEFLPDNALAGGADSRREAAACGL